MNTRIERSRLGFFRLMIELEGGWDWIEFPTLEKAQEAQKVLA